MLRSDLAAAPRHTERTRQTDLLDEEVSEWVGHSFLVPVAGVDTIKEDENEWWYDGGEGICDYLCSRKAGSSDILCIE